VSTLLTRPNPPTALFTAQNLVTIGALRALRRAGRRVPDDVAVVGFDDIASASYIHPPLTTIRQPLADMAAAAFEMATTRGQEVLARPARASFAPELVVRQSAP